MEHPYRGLVYVCRILSKYDVSAHKPYEQIGAKLACATPTDEDKTHFIGQYDKFKHQFEKMSYWNQPLTEILVNSISEQDRNEINKALSYTYQNFQTQLLQKHLMGEQQKLIKEIQKNPSLRSLNQGAKLNINKMQSMIESNPQLKQMLNSMMHAQAHGEKVSDDQQNFAMKGMFESLIQSQLPGLNTEMFSGLFSKFKDINLKDLYLEVKEQLVKDYPEIWADIELWMKMVDLPSIQDILKDVEKDFPKQNMSDISQLFTFVQNYTENNTKLQTFMQNVNECVENKLIDMSKVQHHMQIVSQLVLSNLASKGLVDPEQLTNLTKMFTGKRKPKMTKEQRQERRLKTNRRQIRHKLRDKKKNKKNRKSK